MVSAAKLYADTVRYWYQVNKNIKSHDDEPKAAFPGLGSIKLTDDACISATVYALTMLKVDQANKTKQ